MGQNRSEHYFYQTPVFPSRPQVAELCAWTESQWQGVSLAINLLWLFPEAALLPATRVQQEREKWTPFAVFFTDVPVRVLKKWWGLFVTDVKVWQPDHSHLLPEKHNSSTAFLAKVSSSLDQSTMGNMTTWVGHQHYRSVKTNVKTTQLSIKTICF